MNLTIAAKSAFDDNQLRAKKSYGAKSFEMQMLPDDFNGLSDWKLNDADNKFRIASENDIVSIHLPFLKCDVETDLTPILRSVFPIAAEASKTLGHDVMVVSHNTVHYDQISDSDMMQVLLGLEDVFSRYNGVKLAIENVSFIPKMKKALTQGAGGYFESPVKFVERINGYIGGAERPCVSCLDLCHALITKKYTDVIAGAWGEGWPFDRDAFSLDSYMRTYAPTLGLVHLAGLKRSGYAENHAWPIDTESDDEEDVASVGAASNLLAFVSALSENEGRDIPVVLEVREDDLLDPVGFATTNKSVEKLLA